jgi:hypothetical protein
MSQEKRDRIVVDDEVRMATRDMAIANWREHGHA